VTKLSAATYVFLIMVMLAFVVMIAVLGVTG